MLKHPDVHAAGKPSGAYIAHAEISGIAATVEVLALLRGRELIAYAARLVRSQTAVADHGFAAALAGGAVEDEFEFVLAG